MPRIPLTRGQVAIVDDDDYVRLSRHTWYASLDSRSGRFYAERCVRENGKQRVIAMHREITNAPVGVRVDHVEHEQTLDNRKSNLRLATASQNGANSPAPKNNTSGYKGVCFHKQVKLWQATIMVNRKTIRLGLFHNKILAAKAYDAAAVEYFGEFAYTNFGREPKSDAHQAGWATFIANFPIGVAA